jgi:CheY-like chemotaxis protein
MAKRILVVDDDEMVLMALEELLKPEMDGYELCKRIREKEKCKETPVVFLTAKSRDEDRAKGLEAGANLYLSKPISPDKLLGIVSDALGQKEH